MDYKKQKSICYLVIEILDREFIPLNFLAKKLIKNKIFDEVYIVELRLFLSSIKYKRLPAGVVFLKSAPDYLCQILKQMKKQGFKVIVQNQEGVSVLPSEATEGLQIGHQAMPYIDSIISASDDEYNQLKTFQNIRCLKKGELLRILVPISFWKSCLKKEIEEIKKRYNGDFTLFVSTLGEYCHSLDKVDKNQLEKRFFEDFRENFSNLADEFRVWAQSQMYTFFELGKLVSSFKNEKNQLIIRPHPSDHKEFLKYVFGRSPNVHVISEFPIMAWLLTARHIICSTSTVAIEAVSIGKTPLILLPNFGSESKFLDKLTVNKIGKIQREASKVFAALKKHKIPSKPLKIIDKGKQVDIFISEFERLSFKTQNNFLPLVSLNLLAFMIDAKKFIQPFREKYFAEKFPGFKRNLNNDTIFNEKLINKRIIKISNTTENFD